MIVVDCHVLVRKSHLQIFRCITLNGHNSSFLLIKKPIVVDYRRYTLSFIRRITIYHLNIENGKLLKLTHSKWSFKVIINGFVYGSQKFLSVLNLQKKGRKIVCYRIKALLV